MDICRFYVGGLSSSVDTEAVSTLFTHYGEVKGVEFKEKQLDENTLLRYCFVDITASPTKADACISSLNKTVWKGSRLKVEFAKEEHSRRPGEAAESTQRHRDGFSTPVSVSKKRDSQQLNFCSEGRKRRKCDGESEAESVEDKLLKPFKSYSSVWNDSGDEASGKGSSRAVDQSRCDEPHNDKMLVEEEGKVVKEEEEEEEKTFHLDQTANDGEEVMKESQQRLTSPRKEERMTRLYLGNLAPKVKSKSVKKLLLPYGDISDIDFKEKKDGKGSVSSRFCYVNIVCTPKKLDLCISTLKMTEFKGCRLKIEIAKQNFLDKLSKEIGVSRLDGGNLARKNSTESKGEMLLPVKSDIGCSEASDSGCESDATILGVQRFKGMKTVKLLPDKSTDISTTEAIGVSSAASVSNSDEICADTMHKVKSEEIQEDSEVEIGGDKMVKMSASLNFKEKSEGFSFLSKFGNSCEEKEEASIPTTEVSKWKKKTKNFFISRSDPIIAEATYWFAQAVTEEVRCEFANVRPQLVKLKNLRWARHKGDNTPKRRKKLKTLKERDT